MKYTQIFTYSIASISLIGMGTSLNSCMETDDKVLQNSEVEKEFGDGETFDGGLNPYSKNTPEENKRLYSRSTKELSLKDDLELPTDVSPEIAPEDFSNLKKTIQSNSNTREIAFSGLKKIKFAKLNSGKWITENPNRKKGVKFLEKLYKIEEYKVFNPENYKLKNLSDTIKNFEVMILKMNDKTEIDGNFKTEIVKYIEALYILKDMISYSKRKNYNIEQLEKYVDSAFNNIISPFIKEYALEKNFNEKGVNYDDISLSLKNNGKYFEKNNLIQKIEKTWTENFPELKNGSWGNEFHINKKKREISTILKNLEEIYVFLKNTVYKQDEQNFMDIMIDQQYYEHKKRFIETYENLMKILFYKKMHVDSEAKSNTKIHREGAEYIGDWSEYKNPGISLEQANEVFYLLNCLSVSFAYVESNGELNLSLNRFLGFTAYKEESSISDREYRNLKWLKYILGYICIIHGASLVLAGVVSLPFPAFSVPLIVIGGTLCGVGICDVKSGLAMSE